MKLTVFKGLEFVFLTHINRVPSIIVIFLGNGHCRPLYEYTSMAKAIKWVTSGKRFLEFLHNRGVGPPTGFDNLSSEAWVLGHLHSPYEYQQKSILGSGIPFIESH